MYEQPHPLTPTKKAPAQPAGFSQQCRAIRSHHGVGGVWGQQRQFGHGHLRLCDSAQNPDVSAFAR